MYTINNVTVIIRSVGERTEQLCKKLILDQEIPEKNIFIIRERPFSTAMKVSYQTGLDNKLPWTFCVDADVLLKEDAVQDMLRIAKDEPEHVFGVSGKLLDKYFGAQRAAGNYLFRTKHLIHLINSILPYEEENIRPESSIFKSIQNKGLILKKKQICIGLHDFEQHNHDIARKTFTHSHKHVQHMSELVSFWLNASKFDMDFKIALFGLAKGITYYNNLKINVDEFKQLYREVDLQYGKKNNELSSFRIKSANDVQKAINDTDNYFKTDEIINIKLENDFREKFKEKKYSTLTRYFMRKIIDDIKF